MNKILIQALKLVENENDENLRLDKKFVTPKGDICVAIHSSSHRYIDQSIIALTGEFINCEMYDFQEAIQAMYDESEQVKIVSSHVTYFPKITVDILD